MSREHKELKEGKRGENKRRENKRSENKRSENKEENDENWIFENYKDEKEFKQYINSLSYPELINLNNKYFSIPYEEQGLTDTLFRREIISLWVIGKKEFDENNKKEDLNRIFNTFNDKKEFEDYLNKLNDKEVLTFIKKYTNKNISQNIDKNMLRKEIIDWWLENKNKSPEDRKLFEYNEKREIYSIYDDLSLEEKNKLLTEAKKYSKKENTGKIYSTLIGNLSPEERKIIDKLKETDKYNRENKIILRKLLGKLTDKQLKEITELEDEYSREPLDFDDKDSIIEFIIDNIKLEDYMGKYLSKRKVDYNNLKYLYGQFLVNMEKY